MRLSILPRHLALGLFLLAAAIGLDRAAGVHLISAASASAAEGQETLGQADRDAIQAVINAQLDAFRHDDADGAFALNTPNIRAQFHDPNTFMEIVKRGYAPVYRPKSVLFGPVVKVNDQWMQSVEILGPGGELVEAVFTMEQIADNWAIGGCRLRPSKSRAA